MLEIGTKHTHKVTFTELQVQEFAKITGDTNPLHLDEEFAARSIFKKRILHGMLSATVFSKVFGTQFPGIGTIYLSQSLDFKRPMFIDTPYEARFEVVDIDSRRRRGQIKTTIVDMETGKICVDGDAWVMHRQHFAG